MSLLIGIKSTSTGIGFNGAEGFECATLNNNVFDILSEGTYEKLMTMVAKEREEAKKASLEIHKLSNEMDYASESEYEEKSKKINKLTPKIKILKYDKLLIIDGIIA